MLWINFLSRREEVVRELGRGVSMGVERALDHASIVLQLFNHTHYLHGRHRNGENVNFKMSNHYFYPTAVFPIILQAV